MEILLADVFKKGTKLAMSVKFFQENFGSQSDVPTSGGPFGSLYQAVVTGTVGIYDIIYHAAVWGALIFLVIAIIQFFNSTRGPSRDQAKGKVIREIGIFFALAGVLFVISILIKFSAGVYGRPGTVGF